MNTPEPEPQGGTRTIRVVFLDRSGKPIVDEILEHTPHKLRTDKEGGANLQHLNGSPMRFGSERIPVKQLVQEGVTTILQRDNWGFHFNKV